MLRTSFHTGFQFLGLLDHRNDLFVAGRAGNRLDLNRQLALFHNGSGINESALFLADRLGFTGHGSLIDHCFAICHYTVKRNDVADMDHDMVARHNGCRIHKDFLIPGLYPHFADI